MDETKTLYSGGGARNRESGSPQSSPRGDATEHPKAAETDNRYNTKVLPSVSLPKGGGAIRGVDEKFSINASNGTAGMSVPLPLSPGRGGFTPDLQLSYSSGSGNGIFGFGWSLGTAAITRKTDKGLPQYCDGDESDVFILSSAEDLVPILDATGARKRQVRSVFGKNFEISYYRPRIEGTFARIERWVAADTGLTHWRSISRDNVSTLYGYDTASRIADPTDATKIFSWCISRSWDDKGNLAVYSYAHEDSAGITQAAAHEANRTPKTRAAQIYPTAIQYGNTTPYFPNWAADAEVTLPSTWMFSVVLDYGNYTASPPTPQPDQPWPVRPDPFSSYRAGFELRTYRRVQRVLFFNNFPNEPSAGAARLVRSLDLVYSDQQTPTDPRNPIYTFLVSITQTGYSGPGTPPASRSLPPLELGYSQPQVQSVVQSLDADSLGNLPEGIDGARFRWIDLDGEGLSGILLPVSDAWYYKRNLGADNLVIQPDGSAIARARFGPLEPVTALPGRSALDAQQFLDLGGDGQLDLVALAEPDAGFYKRTADYNFEPFKRFAGLPQLDWSDPNVKFIDLTGDGLADILLTEDGLFTFYGSLGETGFDIARIVHTPWDEEVGPKVVLADGSDTIFIADMSGDGLNDIVRVRNGEACYWPNIGYGRFGAKVTMDQSPRFDNEERFDPARIRLADIDGAGSADLLYIGQNGVSAWFNQSGNAWSTPTTIAVFPSADKLSSVQVFDLMGTGTACLVWSSPLPAQTVAPLLYVDLMGGQKPHLMISARNNLGAETRVTYAPSTQFYVKDLEAGRPWVTRLPFPVQVVVRNEAIDWVGRNRQVTRYAYHHGYYDGYEREFRGFGMVEQWDTEEFRADTTFNDGDAVNWNQQSWSPPVVTRTWFHTGAFQQAPQVSQQYDSEYWVEPALAATNPTAMRPPDTVLPDGLNPYEAQEAYRALKGHPLRVEIYAEIGGNAAGNPYTITESNYTLFCLQNIGINLHAVFLVCPRETISLQYERAAGDPRITYEVTLESNIYGQPTRGVSVGYPRRPGYTAPEPTLSAATQVMLAYDQTRLHIRATEQQYTNAIDDLATWPDSYRVPLASASNGAEITGINPSPGSPGSTPLFSFADLDTAWQTAWAGANDIPYEAVPASDINGTGTLPAALTRRITEQTRTLYRSDDLSALLNLGQLEPLAISGQSYQVALTPGLLSGIFGALVPAATLTEGGYVQLAGETGWWIPSSRAYLSPGDNDSSAQELANARTQFFMPRRSVDPFRGISRVAYDGYTLLATTVTDPVGNVTAASNDYRVLMPELITDPNGNRSAVEFDALGFVTATAVMGKITETLGDSLTGFVTDLDAASLAAYFANPLAAPGKLIGNATTRLVYDLAAYQRTSSAAQPSPPVVATLARETHVSDLAGGTTRYQYGFAYSDGFGREIQRKALVADGALVEGGPTVSPRWAGSGWTIFNNKGKPVRRYEPFFSTTQQFEFAAQSGVSTIILYDPPGRVIATLHPDNTWEKTAFTAWRQEVWDGNDTVLIADPRNDGDVGADFTRCLAGAAFTSWYTARISGTFGASAADQAEQKDAAQKAAAHAATPTVSHFDALGRVCLAVNDNSGGNRFPTRTALDTEGKPLAVYDALGRLAQENCFRAPQAGGGFQYLCGIDMAGNPLYTNNADAGARQTLANVAGHAIRLWDARGQAFRMLYDAAQRPTQRFVSSNGAAEILIALTIYGEGQAAANLCGQAFRHYDMAGFVENTQYDYKVNLLSAKRQLGVAYRAAIDWMPLAGQTVAATLDAKAIVAGLIPGNDGSRDCFISSTVYDALNRPIQSVTPHSVLMRPNVLQPGYDAAARLVSIDVWLQQAGTPAGLLNANTADRHAVTAVAYNARGQRLSIGFGNGTVINFAYDTETFRMTGLTTMRPVSFAAAKQSVQALAYYYDPVGNITHITDNADTQNVIYFNNQRVEPSADYTYDPLYRLITALGREHLGQTGGALQVPAQVINDDSFRMNLPQPGDGQAMGIYTESYTYDGVGNLLTMAHQVSSGGWTRRYSYSETSQIVGTDVGNRLSANSVKNDPVSGPFSATYKYDVHGNMTRMPHLPAMVWDEEDRLRSTTRQVVNSGTPVTSYYVYGFDGQRVRKLTEGQAAAGEKSVRKSERIYLGGLELFREYAGDGTTISLARETLHVRDGAHAVALVETRTVGDDPGLAQQVRYQFGNHLGSAVLELDDQSQIISYEEYFPYGSTSYQAVANQSEVAKRYRFTGKERDEENDLAYHGARYYAPWLGRWTACDPIGLGDGPNLYAYARCRPSNLVDRNGAKSDSSTQDQQNRAIFQKGDYEGKSQEELHALYAKAGHAFRGDALWDKSSHSWFVDRSQLIAPEQSQSSSKKQTETANAPAGLSPQSSAANTAPSPDMGQVGGQAHAASAGEAALSFAEGAAKGALLGASLILLGSAGTLIGVGLLAYGAYKLASGSYKEVGAAAGRLASGEGTTGDFEALGGIVGGLASGGLAGIVKGGAGGAESAAGSTATSAVTRVVTTDARMAQLAGVADSGEVSWVAGDAKAFSAYSDAMDSARSNAGGRTGFNLLRGRFGRRYSVSGPIHHWRFPMTTYGAQALDASNLYLTENSAHLALHQAMGSAGSIYRSMAWGADGELQSMFNFWNSNTPLDQVLPNLPTP